MTGFDPIAQLLRRIEEMERRVKNMIVFGVVTDVDHDKGLVRMSDGQKDDNGHYVKTDWLPWAEHSGKIKTRTMPSVGQQVTHLSPSGTKENGLITIGWFNDDNPMPKAQNGEYVLQRHTNWRQTIADDQHTMQMGKLDQNDTKYGNQSMSDSDNSGSGLGQNLGSSSEIQTSQQQGGQDQHKSIFSQKIGELKHNVDDHTSVTTSPSTITQVATNKVSSQAPRIEDVGKSYLGLDSADQGNVPPLVTKAGFDAKRVFAVKDILDPLAGGPGDPDGPPGEPENPTS